MNIPAPDGAPPRRIDEGDVLNMLALQCLGEALRQGTLAILWIFMLWV
jgi:hypothetical protein